MVWLATRERVAQALDSEHTAYRGDQIDQALAAATDTIRLALHWAHFHPVVATRYFDWPNDQRARSWRLWLDDQGLISVTQLVAGGVTLAPTEYLLEPVNTGPPYTSIEINLAEGGSFGSGDSHQRAIAITGVWGCNTDTIVRGALAEALDDVETDVDGTDGRVGVGHVLVVDSERMVVTDKTWMDTGANLAGDLTADDADTEVTVSAGTFFRGERLYLGAEAMDVKAQTGTTLVVERATDGTVLAAHTGAVDIYAPRRFTVTRGQHGTTPASHLIAAELRVWTAWPLVEALAVAVSMDQVEQEMGAYSRTSGAGSTDRTAKDATGSGLAAAWARAYAAHGRYRSGAL